MAQFDSWSQELNRSAVKWLVAYLPIIIASSVVAIVIVNPAYKTAPFLTLPPLETRLVTGGGAVTDCQCRVVRGAMVYRAALARRWRTDVRYLWRFRSRHPRLFGQDRRRRIWG